jgi:hypothetical protein
MFLLFLIAISLGVFLSEPKAPSSVLIFNKPKVNINMSVFDSDQFKNLQPFSEMETQYSYKATDKDGKQITGFISAVSKAQAQKILEDGGLMVTDLRELEIGRENPFIPYYQIVKPVK